MLFLAIFLGLMPSFLLVGLGGLLRRRLSDNAWQGLDRLNFEILFPALLFVAASSRPIEMSKVAVIGPAVWVILLAGLLLGWFARGFGPDRFLDFAGAWQVGWRFNTAIGLVAVGLLQRGSMTEMAVAVGMAVPVANLFAVSALSRGGSMGLGATFRKVALNPFLLASLGGVIFGLMGWRLPDPVQAPLDMLARAAIPIALLSIGATMNWGALARLDRFNGAICSIKLVILPALTLLGGLVVGVSPEIGSVLVLFAALPTASAAHVLASAFGANRELVATLIAQTTLLSAVTLPIWITFAAYFF
ncbi:AEC family transporter [Aliiroseovarius crassostreae]|uniref:AEC family transporter n=1 Tax=Aliiroseovarius crassostreae TaxID=154981 RepID=UPI0022078CCC|nr:AEC family transporter [Aliiroseovarius crassostreae]UWQ07485.1 AEC family transporter [Aliiroseovarius crassostreae]UWQ10592.1 AEC family transporter [Aliiroseovarius crassostreae]